VDADNRTILLRSQFPVKRKSILLTIIIMTIPTLTIMTIIMNMLKAGR
jgi:hypothetical protein